MKRVVQNIRRVFAYIILYVRYRQTLVGRQQSSSRSKIAMVRMEMEKKSRSSALKLAAETDVFRFDFPADRVSTACTYAEIRTRPVSRILRRKTRAFLRSIRRGRRNGNASAARRRTVNARPHSNNGSARVFVCRVLNARPFKTGPISTLSVRFSDRSAAANRSVYVYLYPSSFPIFSFDVISAQTRLPRRGNRYVIILRYRHTHRNSIIAHVSMKIYNNIVIIFHVIRASVNYCYFSTTT